jgi:hypothetical protein
MTVGNSRDSGFLRFFELKCLTRHKIAGITISGKNREYNFQEERDWNVSVAGHGMYRFRLKKRQAA